MMKSSSNKQGIIKLILVIVIGLAVLAYFKIDIRRIFSSDIFQNNWHYLTDWATWLWREYLAPFLRWLLAKFD